MASSSSSEVLRPVHNAANKVHRGCTAHSCRECTYMYPPRRVMEHVAGSLAEHHLAAAGPGAYGGSQTHTAANAQQQCCEQAESSASTRTGMHAHERQTPPPASSSSSMRAAVTGCCTLDTPTDSMQHKCNKHTPQQRHEGMVEQLPACLVKLEGFATVQQHCWYIQHLRKAAALCL